MPRPYYPAPTEFKRWRSDDRPKNVSGAMAFPPQQKSDRGEINNMVVRQPRYSQEEFAQRGDRYDHQHCGELK